jgi:hypothetical protein
MDVLGKMKNGGNFSAGNTGSLHLLNLAHPVKENQTNGN